MGEVCPNEMTADEFSEMQNGWHAAVATTVSYLKLLESLFVIICAITFFVYCRKLSKPTFIYVMWGLFIVAIIAYFSFEILSKAISDADEAGDNEKFSRLVPYFNESVNVQVVTLMGAHWVFAIKYAEMVLNLPLLVFPETVADIQARLKKIAWAVWSLNGFFAALILIYTLIFQLYIFGVWRDNNSLKLIIRLGIGITLAPTVLLLVAVIRVRCMVSKLRNKSILQKEKIILLHTVLFSLYFLVYATCAFALDVAQSAEDISTQCKATIIENSSQICFTVLNMCIFALITYMSVQFCKPLDGQWQQFLLGYRDKSLNAYLRQRFLSTDQEKARRFHDAAVQDANRLIMIISALLDHTQSTVEQDEEGTQDESFIDSLDTEERRILASSTNTVSSSILLQQVRMETAREYLHSFVQPIDISRSTINEADAAAHTEDDDI